MKKIITLFLFAMFVMQTNLVYAIEAVKVPRGTEVPVYFSSNVNSDRLYSGDIVSVKVAEDIYVNNKKVFAQGSTGFAEVEKAVRSGSHGRAGQIVINHAKIKDVNGQNHTVQLTYRYINQSLNHHLYQQECLLPFLNNLTYPHWC